MTNKDRATRIRLGEFHIDFEQRRVFGNGKTRALSPKACQVLRTLSENAGRVIEREMFFAEVWPSRCVSDDVLTQAVVELRRALGDQQRPRRYIETISKAGYRLLASPLVVQAGSAFPTLEHRGVDPRSPAGLAIWKLITAFSNLGSSRAA